MKTISTVFTAIALGALMLLSLSGCTCGFDCSSDSDEKASFSLSFSGSHPEDFSAVMINVTKITLARDDGVDEVIETFSVGDATNAPSFQLDLLPLRGVASELIISGLEIDADFYDDIIIDITSDDVNSSYVDEAESGERKKIIVAGGSLTLPGFEVLSGTRNYTVEFGLARALQRQENDENEVSYLLTTEGVDILFTDNAASLSGSVSSELFDATTACEGKGEPTAGNRIYLYEPSVADNAPLIDVIDESESENGAPPDAVAFLNLNDSTGKWDYAFGYLPEGNYTIAFACDSSDDDAVKYDEIVIPQPAEQLYQVLLTRGKSTDCDLLEDSGGEC